jgi:hypothetical protein
VPPWHGQPDFAAERGKPRIVLVGQYERAVDEERDCRIASAPGAIEPCEGRLGIVAQRSRGERMTVPSYSAVRNPERRRDLTALVDLLCTCLWQTRSSWAAKRN